MAEDENLKRRNGHFLSAFLCQIQLPLSPGKERKSNMFDSPLVKNYLRSLSEQKDFCEIFKENPESCLEALLSDLQLTGGSEKTLAATSGQFMLKEDGPSFLILSHPRDLDKKIINQLVKLPDILSNVFQGDLPANYSVERLVDFLLYNLLISNYVHKVARDANLDLPLDNLAYCVGCAVTNFAMYENSMRNYIEGLCVLAENERTSSQLFADLVTKMSPNHQAAFLKSIFRHVDSGEKVFPILCGVTPIEKLRPLFVKLLFSRTTFATTEVFFRLVCFLSLAFEPDTLVQKVFLPVLTLWADPVIARAHVKAEVVHYSKLIFLIFSHLSKETVQRFQIPIVEQIVRGLPNHFSSTDPRTVILAKFICELITETLKLYEDRIQVVPDPIQHPTEELCQEVLGAFHSCKMSEHFWHAKVWQSNVAVSSPITSKSNEDFGKTNQNQNDQIDEDDDSDLEPIDTLDAHSKSKIVYIRDFLEGLPELKTFDETRAAFRDLPSVIRHQLGYEHPQIGRDLLDAVFGWENSFESTEFDELKKVNLCMALQTKAEGNVDHFCSFFHRKTLQAHKKNLILDVLTHVVQEVNLKDLEILARVAFRDILCDPKAIERQDTINKIPMILFFQRLLCTLPHEMIREEMMTSYLVALTQMSNIDGATRQTIQYAMHNLMSALEGVPITQGIHGTIVDARSWLWSLKN